MRKLLSITVILLLAVSFLQAGDNTTIMIGKTRWLTEKNSFKDVVLKAKKEKKHILAVFSATWCGPCKRLKKNLFKAPEFSKAADKLILLYVEQTTKEGKKYNSMFKIRAFPTLKLFSPEGKFMDTIKQVMSVDKFMEQIDSAISGNNITTIKADMEKNPKDRKLIMKYVKKLSWAEKDKKLTYMKKALKLNPDFKDPLAQSIYEELFKVVVFEATFNKNKRAHLVKENKSLVDSIIRAYYPDKFRLRGRLPMMLTMNWHTVTGEYKKAIDVFRFYLKKKNNKLDFKKEMGMISDILESFLKSNNKAEADKWMSRIENYISNLKDEKDLKFSAYSYQKALETYAGYSHKKGDQKSADAYGSKMIQFMKKTGQKPSIIEYYRHMLAEKYLCNIRVLIDELAKDFPANKAKWHERSATILASLYHKCGEDKKAVDALTTLYKDKEYINKYKVSRRSKLLNNLAWSFVENSIVNQTALKIAEESVKLSPDAYNMDTLANVHAALGNFPKAIEIEKKALKKVGNNEELKRNYTECIKRWELKKK